MKKSHVPFTIDRASEKGLVELVAAGMYDAIDRNRVAGPKPAHILLVHRQIYRLHGATFSLIGTSVSSQPPS